MLRETCTYEMKMIDVGDFKLPCEIVAKRPDGRIKYIARGSYTNAPTSNIAQAILHGFLPKVVKV